MKLEKGDFIEIEFTGKVKDGEVFDSNIKGSSEGEKSRNFIYSLGGGMFLEALDNFLIGKEPSEYEIALKPKEAFGERNSSLVKLIPTTVFRKQKINPMPGDVLDFDGKMGKILSVSSGRNLVDFNNPLAGKDVEYKINVLRKVEEMSEKVESLNKFFFNKKLKFEIKDKKLIFEVDKKLIPLINLFHEKYKDLLGIDLEVSELVEESKNKKI